MSETRIEVGGEQPYEVVVGAGILSELPGLVGKRAETAAVIHDERLGAVARPACRVLQEAGYRVVATEVPSGEAAKDVTVLARLWSWLAESKMTRSDCVVSVGGGAVTDLAGFAAATWLRGVPVVHIPTTLLGMVDAAVGGKTAIDIAAGKNLVGAFHPPAGVLADLATLETLPREDYVAGLAEVIKAGFIADGEILRLVAADPDGAAKPHGQHARELVERAIAMKARVVSADLRESGLRETLNYGHTLAHAIEKLERYTFRHGDAVAIGMVFAAEVGRLSGRLTEREVALHKELLTAVGLPVGYPRSAWPALRETMSLDKKARGARLRMIVLDGVGNPVIYDSPPEDLLTEAYQAVAAVTSPVTAKDEGAPSAAGRRVLVLNGPNLGRLGKREPSVYGTATHADLAALCQRAGKELGLDVEVRQTEYEGELVTWIHEACDGQLPVVLNAGALTHYSYALMDAVKMRTAPLIEVHISNIAAREGFRHESVITGAATGIIAGFGFRSYVLALHAIKSELDKG